MVFFRAFIAVFLLSSLSSCGQSVADKGNSNVPSVTRGAYLQQLTSHSIIIRWRTDAATDSKVKYGKNQLVGSSAVASALTTEHIVQLDGLEPSTLYYYAIGSTNQVLQGDSLNKFITAPAKGVFLPTRIWATGDFGSGSQAQKDVREAYKNYSVIPTNIWLWLGDNAYASGTDSEYQCNVFNIYPEQLKQFPLYPVPGNHDYGNVGYQSAASLTENFAYYSIFTVPQQGEAGGIASGTPKYYSYDYSNIHFISLDSYGSLNNPGSPMYEWLVRDLSANTQRWTIVYFHHPPYTKGTHNSDTEIELIDMRTHILPLLETFKVDLVLSGHSHVNERSYLIKGHYGTSETFDGSMKVSQESTAFVKRVPYEGTIYAVCGTSGQYLSPPQNDHSPMPCMYFNNYTTYCSMVIDVAGDLLTSKYLSSSGTVIDQFSIVKTGPIATIPSGESSCEISYHAESEIIYFSLYLTKSEKIKAALFNMNGEIVQEFNELPSALNTGYSVQAAHLNKSINSSGIYVVKMLIGDKQFVKKIFLKSHN